MMPINRILKNPRVMSAMTGTTPKEFANLLPTFEMVWKEAKEKQHENNRCARSIGGGRKSFLKTSKERLFFILFYFKCYPTYDVLGVIFDRDRSNTCRTQFELSGMLETTLGERPILPKRQIRTMQEFFEAFPETKDIFIDGTERPTQRPKDKEEQKKKTKRSPR